MRAGLLASFSLGPVWRVSPAQSDAMGASRSSGLVSLPISFLTPRLWLPLRSASFVGSSHVLSQSRASFGRRTSKEINAVAVESPSQTAVSSTQVQEEGVSQRSRFVDLALSEGTLRALREGLGLEEASELQSMLSPLILNRTDLLVHAAEGTGRTLSSLIAVAENLRFRDAKHGYTRKLGAVIFVPTKRDGMRIADQARQVFEHTGGQSVLCILSNERKSHVEFGDALDREYPDVVIAIPKVLRDFLKTSSQFFGVFLSVNVVFVYDAEKLLEPNPRWPYITPMTLLEEIVPTINSCQSGKEVQSVIFTRSRTPAVSALAREVLKPSYTLVDATSVKPVYAPANVSHTFAISTVDDMLSSSWAALQQEVQQNSRVLVFAPTDELCQFYASIFRQMGVIVDVVFRRKPRKVRRWTGDSVMAAAAFSEDSDEPRVLMSSEPVGELLDYAKVSAVLQIGAPSSARQYIERAAPTLRPGRPRNCMLLLYDFEAQFPIWEASLQLRMVNVSLGGDPGALSHVAFDIHAAVDGFNAWMLHYGSQVGKLAPLERQDFVELGKRFAASAGLRPPYPLFLETSRKLKIKDLPDIRIAH